METSIQQEFRRENVLVQALGCFSASFLFLRAYVNKPSEPFQIPDGVYLGLSIFFILVAFFLIIAPLNKLVLSKAERVAMILWLSISYTTIAGIFISWLEGVVRLDPNGLLFNWYFWAGLVWIFIFAYHFLISAHQQGRKFKTKR